MRLHFIPKKQTSQFYEHEYKQKLWCWIHYSHQKTTCLEKMPLWGWVLKKSKCVIANWFHPRNPVISSTIPPHTSFHSHQCTVHSAVTHTHGDNCSWEQLIGRWRQVKIFLPSPTPRLCPVFKYTFPLKTLFFPRVLCQWKLSPEERTSLQQNKK